MINELIKISEAGIVRILILTFSMLAPFSAPCQSKDAEETYSEAIKKLKKYGKSGSRFDRWDAEDLLKKAAEKGSPQAQYCVYLMSAHAEMPDGNSYVDTEISKEEGYENLEKAADSGHIDAIAQMAYLCAEIIGDHPFKRNYEKAYNYCLKLNEAGDERAYPIMGQLYEEGLYVEKDYSKAIEWYNKALAKGCNNLADDIAQLYFITGDYKNAERMYEKYFKLAQKGKLGWGIMSLSDSKLICWIESCFAIDNYDKAISVINKYAKSPLKGLKGSDIKNWNSEKADMLYMIEETFEEYYQADLNPKHSAILRHIYTVDSNPSPEICYNRATNIIAFNSKYHSTQREGNYLMALPWLEKAKPYKDEVGQFSMWVGQQFFNDKEFNKAKEWYERAISYGETYGYRLMAELYENPCDPTIASNPQTSLKYWKEFADTGDAYGLYTVGRYYKDGLASDVDLDIAKEYYQRAATVDSGDASLYAMDNLASCYIATKDWEKAFYWLNKAYAKGLLRVCHNLGDLYYHGRGTEQSYTKAFGIFKQGAENDDAVCKYRVAYMLRNGLGTKVDYAQSNSLLQEAAFANCGQALYLLGTLFYSGDNIDQDYALSVGNLTKALEDKYLPESVRGDIYRKLSVCYRFGRGVELNEQKADEYIRLASAGGDADAIKIEEWLNMK